jgi:hemolysin III
MVFLDLREPVSALSHGTWLLMSLPATWLLWRRSGGDRAKCLSLLVFGLSLAFCYAGSVLYHGVRLSRSWLDHFNRLDHIGIFVLIAGSYTPIAWNLMKGGWKWGTLTVVWSLCAIGTVLLLTVGVLPSFWSTAFYLAMGWGALVCYVELTKVLPHRALLPLLLGGICYSVGALLNLLGWPVIWRGIVGPHEVFHVLVMAGSFSHFWFMLRVVVPYTGASAGPWVNDPKGAALVETLASAHVAPEVGPSVPGGYGQPLFLWASPHSD